MTAWGMRWCQSARPFRILVNLSGPWHAPGAHRLGALLGGACAMRGASLRFTAGPANAPQLRASGGAGAPAGDVGAGGVHCVLRPCLVSGLLITPLGLIILVPPLQGPDSPSEPSAAWHGQGTQLRIPPLQSWVLPNVSKHTEHLGGKIALSC